MVIGLSGALKHDQQEENTQATQTAAASLERPGLGETIEEGDYAVLVFTPGEDDSDASQGVFRPIVQDLSDTLERDIPFSNIRIIPYPLASLDDGEQRGQAMREVVDEINPALVIMFEERNGQVMAEISIGSLEPFPNNVFERDVLERMVNVEVAFTNPEEETLVPHVLTALGVLHTANNDVFEAMRVITILAEVDGTTAQVTSGGVNSYLHEYMKNYLTDT